ncbi:SGNH/GDSL hydrolase family protein [Leifsonia aquatica]|uniref:SGNH/GDSL hydrolase family protein n=1 Tax=Leifsonia aquatica TaxID=144185 RepID=UPI0004686AA2|nr:SGNH/GDSL hydrolase family protein [Leifsonia aquatica]
MQITRPRTRRPLSLALAVAALAVAATALTGCAATAKPVAAESAAAPAAAERPSAVAIGDSIAFGKGVGPGEAWPALIAEQHGWRLDDLAVSGSGFIKAGWNGTTYRDQVDRALKLHPEYILIAATRNDRDQDPAAVTASADRLLGELRDAFPKAHIIGITGIWGADPQPATMDRVDDIVGAAVRTVGGDFLDLGRPLEGKADLLQADGIHPNAAGQRAVAARIENRLAPLAATL